MNNLHYTIKKPNGDELRIISTPSRKQFVIHAVVLDQMSSRAYVSDFFLTPKEREILKLIIRGGDQ